MKKNSIGLLQSRSSTMLETGSAFFRRSWMTWSSRTPCKTRAKSWSCPWNPPYFARFKILGMETFVAKANPTLADQNMHASWRPTNLRESALERLDKKSCCWEGFNSLKFILMLQAMKITDAIAAVGKGWEEARKMPARQLTKVRSKKKRSSKRHRKREILFTLLR